MMHAWMHGWSGRVDVYKPCSRQGNNSRSIKEIHDTMKYITSYII